MNVRHTLLTMIVPASILFLAACTPQATPPPVDIVGTMAAQLASEMLTQTVAAYSPTPPPATSTPIPTETATPAPTKDPNKNIVTVVKHTPCWFGPGSSYGLVSYINVPKKVELRGIGSVPGWYIIKNPYFNSSCWVAIEDVQVDDDVDLANFPVVTP